MKKLSKKILLTTLILTLFLITISSASAEENTTDLGNLITTAPDNSIVELGEGTYKTNVTNINIDKNLTIVGKGADKTIIDANKAGRIFNIVSNGTLTLINLTLINGNAEGGGAIYNYGKLTMTNCIITNNTDNLYYGGGAIYNGGSDLEINKCIFTNNICIYGNGGAIYNEYDAKISINNSFFENNKANSHGGAIYNHGIITIDNSNFINNNANSAGGAISNSGTMTITNSNFTNNNADYNGGAISNSRTMTATNSIFINNSANYDGGAIFNAGNQMSIINSKFIDNTASNGGAIINTYLVSRLASTYPMIINYEEYNIIIINSTFTNNTANYGGAIYNNRDYMLVENSVFNNNTADSGSAIYNAYVSNLTVINSNFTDNKGGSTLDLSGINTIIIGCNIFNNTQGIVIGGDSDAIINYNRIFNNTNNTGFNLDDEGIGSNLDFNWWGDNTPKVNGILNNYFIMNVNNLTSLDSNGTVTFQYTFKLNNTDSFNASLLPYFVTNVYTNVTDGVVNSFDARYDRTFDVTVNSAGNILYTFINDNEIQTLEGAVTIPEPVDPVDPIDPIDPDDPEDPTDTDIHVDPVDPTDSDKTNNNPTASAVMKETGIPINLIILAILSVLGVIIGRKQKI